MGGPGPGPGGVAGSEPCGKRGGSGGGAGPAARRCDNGLYLVLGVIDLPDIRGDPDHDQDAAAVAKHTAYASGPLRPLGERLSRLEQRRLRGDALAGQALHEPFHATLDLDLRRIGDDRELARA